MLWRAELNFAGVQLAPQFFAACARTAAIM